MTPLEASSPSVGEMPAACTIVPAECSDLECICRFDPNVLCDRRQREFVATAIEEGRCWTAFFDETPAGYGIFDYQFQGHGVIHRIFVDADYRRRGIGRALIDFFGETCSSPRLYIGVPQRELAMLELLRTRRFTLAGVVHDNDGSALIYIKSLRTVTPMLAVGALQ